MSGPPVYVIPPEPPRRPAWLRPELVSSWTEFIVVAGLLLLFPIRSSTLAALEGSSSHFMQMLGSNHQLLVTVVAEALALALFFVYLQWRGWKPADLRIGIGWTTSAEGVALLILAHIGVMITVFGLLIAVYALQTSQHSFVAFLMAFSPQIGAHTIHLSWLVIFVAMILNAFLEEIICMGYIFNQLAARRGPIVAVVGTVFLRMACHTYQDPIHLAGIGVLFSIYAVCYIYVRKLWPLIFAHLLLDIGSMSVLKLLFG